MFKKTAISNIKLQSMFTYHLLAMLASFDLTEVIVKLIYCAA